MRKNKGQIPLFLVSLRVSRVSLLIPNPIITGGVCKVAATLSLGLCSQYNILSQRPLMKDARSVV